MVGLLPIALPGLSQPFKLGLAGGSLIVAILMRRIMATRITNQKLSKSSRDWMREHLDDPYVKKAQKEGYRARAAYKLLEMQEKYKIIKPGMTVVDFGAALGSWSQIAGKLVGSKGLLIASDILEMDALPDVTFLQGDFQTTNFFLSKHHIFNISNIGLDSL